MNKLTLNTNEILDAGAYLKLGTSAYAYDMKTTIKKNILSDYGINGVKEVEFSIFPSNLKYANGVTAKILNDGDIPQVDDVIIINGIGERPLFVSKDNDTIYFRITSRTFKYEGEPTIVIKAQEIKEGI